MRILVVGVGNRQRKDNWAGPAVVERLRSQLPSSIARVECVEEPVQLLDLWNGRECAVLVDAAKSGAAAGTIHRFEATDRFPDEMFGMSTHALNLPSTVQLARGLGRFPGKLVVYGIEGADFGLGEGLSSEVEQSLAEAAELVLAEALALSGSQIPSSTTEPRAAEPS